MLVSIVNSKFITVKLDFNKNLNPVKKIILILFLVSQTSFSQTTYLWTGNISTSFSAAGNWAPPRPVMVPTDILIIENGGNINITNVNQITVGQLIIRNNSFVRMSPGSGNQRILSVQGVQGTFKKGQNKKIYYIGDLKYNEYSDSESMGQDVDVTTSKYNEYKIPDSKGMGDVKFADKDIDQIPVTKGIGDLKYSEHELFSFTDGDLVIDTGSSLEITANNPALCIYVKQNANAIISGSLTFSGTQENYINSYDSNAIEFKTGSLLIQSCPGYIFTNSGISNSVVFENGSIFNINNTQAANPFGLSTPNSKVRFERGSDISISASIQNLRFKGRKLPNLSIQNNSDVIVIDSSTSFSVDSINVTPNSSLKVCSRNDVNRPVINIKGNLNISGTLIFADSSYSLNGINFDGDSLQSICGSGDIIFPSIGEVIVNNNIRLFKNLVIACPINQANGSIDYNGYTIFTGGGLGKPEAIKSKSENNGVKTGLNTPSEFSLSQNHPNPFNPVTNIKFAVPNRTFVKLVIYDMLGKEVEILVNSEYNAGTYDVNWNASNYPSGVYFYRLNAGDYSGTKKMVLVK